MPYREDLDAAIARIDALEAEATTSAEGTRLLELELAAAKALVVDGSVDLGSRRKSRNLAIAAAGSGVALAVLLGALIVRAPRDCPRHMCPEIDPTPAAAVVVTPAATSGILFSSGPDLGNWTLRPNRCVYSPREALFVFGEGSGLDRFVQVSIAGGLDKPFVEVAISETHTMLVNAICTKQFSHRIERRGDELDGYLDIDCAIGTNTLRGRIAFTRCGGSG